MPVGKRLDHTSSVKRHVTPVNAESGAGFKLRKLSMVGDFKFGDASQMQAEMSVVLAAGRNMKDIQLTFFDYAALPSDLELHYIILVRQAGCWDFPFQHDIGVRDDGGVCR
jgi:hypothetical protein